MANLSGRKEHGPTPHRITEVILDYGAREYGNAQPHFSRTRKAGDLRPDPNASYGVLQLSSGGFILAPTNDSSEKANTSLWSGTLRLSEWSAAPWLEEIPYWRAPTDLTGATTGASANVQSTGDYWIKKRVGSSTDWSTGGLPITLPPVPFTVDPAGRPAGFAMDRVLEFKAATFGVPGQDMGYYLRWALDDVQYLDTLFVFYFGGLLDADGHGQFALQIDGDGSALLWERETGDTVWVMRDRWQWQTDGQHSPSFPHSIRILPHGGRYIEFRHGVTDVSTRYGPENNLLTIGRAETFYAPFRAATHLYTDRNHKTSTLLGMTGPGAPRLDWNRTARLRMQVNVLRYPTATTGFLLDAPMDTLPTPTTTPLFRVTLSDRIYSTATAPPVELGSFTVGMIDAKSGVNLLTGSEVYTDSDGQTVTFAGFHPLAQQESAVQVGFTFATTDPSTSPVLFGYTVSREAYPSSLPGLAPTTTKQIKEVSVMGATSEPDTETAHVALIDKFGVLTGLPIRASAPILIRCAYDPNDATKKFNIFRGYMERAERLKRGGVGRLYTNWVNYDLTCRGMWVRLYETLFGNSWPDFTTDVAAGPGPTGDAQPWTFTHILSKCLTLAGFNASQISIPDETFRPWFNPDKHNFSLLRPDPRTSIGDYIVYLCTFLGRYLLWDVNAANDGLWRLASFPTGNEPVLFAWQSTPPGGSPRVVHRLESYGAGGGYMLRAGYRDYVVPPEGNYLHVIGTSDDKDQADLRVVQRVIRNYQSYSPDPGVPTADATDMDYLGRIVPLLWFDPFLTEQKAVDWIARRLANVALRGYRIYEWTGPYVIVTPQGRQAFVYQTPTSGDTTYTSGSHATIAVSSPENGGAVPTWWQVGDTLKFASGATATITGIVTGDISGQRLGLVQLNHAVTIAPGGLIQNTSRADPMYATGTKRPLMFGDLVSVDGTLCMMRAVSPAWRRDGIQFARYEAQQFRPNKW